MYMMSASELGETATEVEESLEQVLELANKWNAILLLDECDMFLEARSASDIRRNRLVSGKSQAIRIWSLAPEMFVLQSEIVGSFTLFSLPEAARVLSRRHVPDKQSGQ